MKRLLALLLLAVLVPHAQAALDDDTDFSEGYYVRVANGDIPRTDVTEGPGWNVVEYVRVQHDGNRTEVPLGFGGVDLGCTCDATTLEGTVAVIADDVPEGEHTLAIRHSRPDNQAFSLDLAAFGASRTTDASINVFVPPGMTPTTNAVPSVEGLPSTDGTAAIYQYNGTQDQPLPGGFWLVVAPESVSSVQGPDAPSPAGFDWLALALGILGGIVIWAFLVQRGYAQKRRRQQVSESAHAELAARESKDVLAGRKRALLAALKELEVAKMNKEIDTPAYDQLKGELKRQAVTTMRALEDRD